MYAALTVPRCNLRSHAIMNKIPAKRASGYTRGLGDQCAIDARSGLRVCGGDAEIAQAATGAVNTPPAIDPSLPRYMPATFDWKPPGVDHVRGWAFLYHSGQIDVYRRTYNGDCSGRCNYALVSAPGAIMQSSYAPPKQEPAPVPVPQTATGGTVVAVNTNTPAGAPSVAYVNSTPFFTEGATSNNAGYAQLPTAGGNSTPQASGLFSSVSEMWNGLPEWGKLGIGGAGAYLLMRYMRGGRR